ncbi:hypothetical protein WS86_10435 [Burkholderia savannae]|uniref:DUF2968 domain-containing protein n=1 Tax=Burkholderia savannae TaxID=1637837 RepID=A0ABR5TED2_9BURK|nr:MULTISPECIES: DUF2968 domain-containing protein [Burkholderia]AOJ80987.1 hypothetical protein WS86_10435 [Burkholderia savannae]KWZ43211.1 hypothetical protein WS72_10295 [Burkholderia savannae]KWZ46234.1 hypothetical protein WS73_19415 [Burkholderia savannae]
MGRVFVAIAAAGGLSGAHAQALGSAGGALQASPALTASAAPVPAAAVSASAVVNLSAPGATAAASADANGASTIDELQRQIQARELTEMRTTYNGSYGASLLLNVDEGTYFVALFQQKAFWRVIKTASDARAEAVYRDFAKQSETLAVNELQAAKLESQKAQADRQIAAAQERANRLQADLNIAREQRAAVASRQKDKLDETVALRDQRNERQDQLRKLQQQVRSLQRQADAGLPKAR